MTSAGCAPIIHSWEVPGGVKSTETLSGGWSRPGEGTRDRVAYGDRVSVSGNRKLLEVMVGGDSRTAL